MARDERPVAELLRELSEQTSTLVHDTAKVGLAAFSAGLVIGKWRS